MIDCVDPEFSPEPGQSATITILTQKSLGDQAEAAATIENCAMLRWPLGDTSAPEAIARSVQIALALYGYDPGQTDGSVSTETEKAIASYQKDHGMKETGKIDLEFLNAIFGSNETMRGDASGENDRSCLRSLCRAQRSREAAIRARARIVDTIRPSTRVGKRTTGLIPIDMTGV